MGFNNNILMTFTIITDIIFQIRQVDSIVHYYSLRTLSILAKVIKQS